MFKNLAFVFFIISGILTISAQEKSDREESRLFGFVKSVTEYRAEIEFKNGKPVEKKRYLNSIETFDIAGRKLTWFWYGSDGGLISGNTFIYDNNGRLTEVRTKHDKIMRLCDKKIYLYNQSRKLSEEQCFTDDGKMVGKSVFRYDASGLLFEEESISLIDRPLYFNNYIRRRKFDEKGREIENATFKKVNGEWLPEDFRVGYYKWILAYDERGNIARRQQISANETVFEISETFYDDKGNELESVEYNAQGNIKGRQLYQYEFDSHGNYIKEIDFEWNDENGKTFFQPDEITYRKIEYFRSSEIKEFKAKSTK